MENAILSNQTYFDDVTQLIGNTPLLKLNNMFKEQEVFAKLEYYNPTFSIKDRAAFYMVKKAIEKKQVQKGHTIIAATSGNTGLGLCLASNYFGLNYLCVTFDSVPNEKISLLKAFGATVVICDSEAESDEEGGYVWVAEKLNEKIENSYLIDQFTDINNPLVHYMDTGHEIWRQMNGEIDYYFSTIGTGGTITGVGRYLKKMNPNIKVIGVEPEGGIYRKVFKNQKYNFDTHLINSISDCFISPNTDFEVIDDIIGVSDNASFNMCYRALQNESLCIGTSSGCVLRGIEEYINKYDIGKNKRIVTIFPDMGLKYINTLYDLDFLESNNINIDKSKKDDNLKKYITQDFAKYKVKVAEEKWD
ncbi:cysteine synthase family protein [Metasolibacillus meyeri]|uniref:Cysteine synthase family protein n=1 Tax=Metasolibacillus meyeri TaxID=1071052 RepID=A0AAW9NQM6_9BACL|nr:cysteine synthase family protein [Metasolibacillus meyeri]MEC1178647.1 cysteine synthase family protein [Metasolibacillus meyeri]